ncbi:PREDICTED: FERM domain-containing protein 7-like [Acropora digitifera]|uniref:FERM domain-containing protein 7-like n=1 Tax=Acropora digitifera TaxID=70779 RepID=UPI00077A4C51|nr:PREDICTED: FERM domain-containing protein 7-like [Acropora digitifera]
MLVFFRYLFALQIKRDLLSGRLKCSENTAALSNWHLTLFKENLVIMIQGPVEVDIYQNINSFLIRLQILKKRISTYHKEHRNLSPADADYKLLDVARRLEIYGVILYPAKVKHCNIELLLLK